MKVLRVEQMRRPKRIKLPAMLPPISIEMQYKRVLKRLTREMEKITREILFPKLPDMVSAAEPFDPAIHIDVDDDWQDQLNNALEEIVKRLKKPTREALQELDDIATATDGYNARRWQSLVRKAYGVSPTNIDQKRYDYLLRTWAEDNAKLITDIPAKTMRQVRNETIDALVSGKTVDQMKEAVLERMDVSDSRAELIARDQVSKLNADLTESRQKDSGVERYIWRTMQDERVRDEHADCDGETFSWDSDVSEGGVSKPDGNDPGGDFQCRCFAEPMLPSRMAFEASLLEEA